MSRHRLPDNANRDEFTGSATGPNTQSGGNYPNDSYGQTGAHPADSARVSESAISSTATTANVVGPGGEGDWGVVSNNAAGPGVVGEEGVDNQNAPGPAGSGDPDSGAGDEGLAAPARIRGGRRVRTQHTELEAMGSHSAKFLEKINAAKEQVLRPTTKNQVSGHKFLVRRAEHGLLFGDIRLLHDPWGARRKATIVGVVAGVLAMVAAGVVALINPEPDPGNAPLWQAETGELYVRVDELIHPVSNLVSARLILQEAVEATGASDQAIADSPRGLPIGLPLAPAGLSPQAPEGFLTVCSFDGMVNVRTDARITPLAPDQIILAGDWVLDAQGKHLLPAGFERDIILRRLGGEGTPAREIPAELVGTLTQGSDITANRPVPVAEQILVTADDEHWLLRDGAIRPLSQLQYDILADLGATLKPMHRWDVAKLPAAKPYELFLPEQAPTVVDAKHIEICRTADGGIGTLDPEQLFQDGLPLGERAIAQQFFRPQQADGALSFGLESAFNHWVLSDTGMVYSIPDAADIAALGIESFMPAEESIIRLLIPGPELSQAAALKTLVEP